MKRIMRPCPNCGSTKYEAIQYNCTVTTPIVGVDDDLEAVRFDTAAVSIDTEDAEVTFQCAVCGKEVVCGSNEDFIDEIGEINFKSAAKIDRQALRKNVPTLAKDKNLLYIDDGEEVCVDGVWLVWEEHMGDFKYAGLADEPRYYDKDGVELEYVGYNHYKRKE